MHEHNCLIIGASGGIGADISRRLATMRSRLFIHGRNSEKLQSFSRELRDLGSPQVNLIVQDLRERDDIHKLIQKIQPHKSLIDIAVISFGPLSESSIEHMNPKDLEFIIDMNLLLPSSLIQILAPAMCENGWGRIIVFGGTGTDQNRAYSRIAAYSAAKYGLNSIVRSSAREFSGKNLTINAICPGYIKTEYYSQKNLDNLKKTDKLLEPDNISDIIEFLISNSASAVNGAIINAGEALEW